MRKVSMFVLGMVCSSVALATGVGHSDPPKTQTQSQHQSQSQSQKATARASAKAAAAASSKSASSSVSSATGGNASAEGGSASASNEGNSLTAVSNEARSAPSVAQGSLVLTGCGVAGNGGGSNTRGSAFLGLAFTTPGCWDQVMIQNEAAMGNIVTACEMNRLTKQGKRNMDRLRKAGIEPEPCAKSSIVVVTAPAGITREEVIERDNRVLETASKK